MPPSSKQPAQQPTTRTTQPSVTPAPPSDQPFLRFYHSESLRAKTFAVLTTLEQAQAQRSRGRPRTGHTAAANTHIGE